MSKENISDEQLSQIAGAGIISGAKQIVISVCKGLAGSNKIDNTSQAYQNYQQANSDWNLFNSNTKENKDNRMLRHKQLMDNYHIAPWAFSKKSDWMQAMNSKVADKWIR